jgi:hypothetical protein
MKYVVRLRLTRGSLKSILLSPRGVSKADAVFLSEALESGLKEALVESCFKVCILRKKARLLRAKNS